MSYPTSSAAVLVQVQAILLESAVWTVKIASLVKTFRAIFVRCSFWVVFKSGIRYMFKEDKVLLLAVTSQVPNCSFPVWRIAVPNPRLSCCILQYFSDKKDYSKVRITPGVDY